MLSPCEMMIQLLPDRMSDPSQPRMAQHNSMEAARRGVRPAVRRRFYAEVTVAAADGAFLVCLDGKPARSPARRLLAAPVRAVADTMAAEWQAQGEVIEPAKMPLTRLANAIIDGVTDSPQPVTAEIANYLRSDLVFYRASHPRGLVERQRRHWDPILAWADEALGARFQWTEGVIYIAQPEPALRAAAAAIPDEAWRLGALHALTTLTGSALIALATANGALSAQAAWQAANVDEDWNMDQWGRDELALERRDFRFAELAAAVTVLRS
jgi:chaperone required for assembly of F1-ATPase